VVSSFGVPITRLAQYIDMSAEQRAKSGIESGIPTTDTTANGELHQWVLQARNAVAELHNVPMLVSIKGDADEEYPSVRKIVDILQRQKINKFSLITSAEAAAK
jgi:biopolymer transport protein ExbD